MMEAISWREVTWPCQAQVSRVLGTLFDLFLLPQRCYFSVAATQASSVSDILQDHKDLATCFSSGQAEARGKEVEGLGCRHQDQGSWSVLLVGHFDHRWEWTGEDRAFEGSQGEATGSVGHDRLETWGDS